MSENSVTLHDDPTLYILCIVGVVVGVILGLTFGFWVA